MPRLRVSYPSVETSDARMIIIRSIFLCVSVSCFLWSGKLWLDRYVHQAIAERQFSDRRSETPAGATSDSLLDRRPSNRPELFRRPVARLQIARLGVSGFVEEGFDAKTLGNFIGLSPQGAKPGEDGNIILAGHRDTFFAGLRGARKGDLVVLEAATGDRYEYVVTRTFVVEPTASWVMQPTPGRRMLTLITCYPFRYIGSAPQRFVVQAEQRVRSSERELNRAVV